MSATGATIDPDTFVLTVERENAEPFSVDLAKLAEIAVENGANSAITLTGNGTKSNALKADVKISSAQGNALEKKEGGLYVAKGECVTLRDIFGQPLGEGGQDIKVVLCKQ